MYSLCISNVNDDCIFKISMVHYNSRKKLILMPQEMKEQAYGQIMANLENYVGKEVTAIYWEKGTLHGLKGNLSEVVPFNYINLEGKRIDFLGEANAIQCIAFQDSMNLYYNHGVENYQGFNLNSVMALILAQEEILGHSVKRDELMAPSEDTGRGM